MWYKQTQTLAYKIALAGVNQKYVVFSCQHDPSRQGRAGMLALAGRLGPCRSLGPAGVLAVAGRSAWCWVADAGATARMGGMFNPHCLVSVPF